MDDTCDFPGCDLQISQKCARCGRAMCVRHIQWVGDQTVRDAITFTQVLSAHYACDLCLHPAQTGRLFAQETGWAQPGRAPGVFSGQLRAWRSYRDAWLQAYTAWSWDQPVPPPTQAKPPAPPPDSFAGAFVSSFADGFLTGQSAQRAKQQARKAQRLARRYGVTLSPGSPLPAAVLLRDKLRRSLLWSLIGWLAIVGPVVGLVYGYRALKEINQSGGQLQDMRRRAIICIAVGWAMAVFVLVDLIVGLA